MIDRFYLMTVFVAVAEAQGFAAAGRRLSMSPPAVTRAVAALEDHLGVRLLTRTTRTVRVTEAGARYLTDAQRIIADLDEADAAAAGNNTTPRGQLHVTAPVLFGKHYVMPVITAYQQEHELTTVTAMFVDRVVNLIDEGMDVGIRIGPLPDSSLRAIPVGRVRRVLVAAPDYLDRQGIPTTPADLTSHTTIAATRVSAGAEWTFGAGDAKTAVRVTPRLQVNTNDGAMAAAIQGFGITRLLSYQVAGEVAAGTLKVLLSNFEEAAMPIHVVHREGRHGSAKVRSFVDLAVASLRAQKALA